MLDRIGEDKAVALSVLGYICELVLDGLLGAPENDFLAVQYETARDAYAVGTPENTHRELRSAGTHETVDTYDLTLADIHGYVVDYLSLGKLRMIDSPVLDFHEGIADLDIMTLRETVGHITVYHALDDTVLGDLVCLAVECLDRGTVSDDRDLVCYVRYFVQLMGDDDHRHSLLLEFLHQIEESSGVCLVQ